MVQRSTVRRWFGFRAAFDVRGTDPELEHEPASNKNQRRTMNDEPGTTSD
jgi:hypothetical protein